MPKKKAMSSVERAKWDRRGAASGGAMADFIMSGARSESCYV